MGIVIVRCRGEVVSDMGYIFVRAGASYLEMYVNIWYN